MHNHKIKQVQSFTVRTKVGSTYNVPYEPTLSVDECVKRLTRLHKLASPGDRFVFIHKGSVLLDGSKTLQECSIYNGTQDVYLLRIPSSEGMKKIVGKGTMKVRNVIMGILIMFLLFSLGRRVYRLASD